MDIKNTLMIILVLICLATETNAQWGEMQLIYWENPPDAEIGYFNPSFCVYDSILYFDDFPRYEPYYGQIWQTKMIIDEYGFILWSDPDTLPYPINYFNQSEIANCMPYITVSGDTLFFCSDREGTYGGLDIWMSVKEDTTWSEPTNLGDSINSDLDELSPHFGPESGILFFDRLEQSIGYHYAIYRSAISADGIWQGAERLPEVVNPIDSGGYDASYDEQCHILYFDLNDDIFSSIYSDGEWSEPQKLGSNVNGLASYNECGYVSTFGAAVSSDNNWLFYSKDVWQYECWDFTSFLFFSERTVGIDEENEAPLPEQINFKIYPNPSNSSFTINIGSIQQPYNIAIYNVLGQEVREYSNCTDRSIVWDGSNQFNKQVVSGIYFVKINTGREILTKKLLLQK